jgi:hypothetical protein
VSARRKPVSSKEPVTLAEVHQRHCSIFDRYFSVEQQAQINRLQVAGDFEGETESEAVDKTIATLAATALYILGLDPLADENLYRLSEIVFGANSGFPSHLFNSFASEDWLKAGDWTKEQRAAEIGETPRPRCRNQPAASLRGRGTITDEAGAKPEEAGA